MALPFVGKVKSSAGAGLVSKVEIRQQGTGSFLDCGLQRNATVNVDPVAMKGDPAGTNYVQYLRFSFQFDLIQTGSAELSALAGTAGTGLYDTDVEVKFTFVTGRTLTLGAVSGYPLRLVAGYKNDTEIQVIPCSGETLEPVTSFNAKVA